MVTGYILSLDEGSLKHTPTSSFHPVFFPYFPFVRALFIKNEYLSPLKQNIKL